MSRRLLPVLLALGAVVASGCKAKPATAIVLALRTDAMPPEVASVQVTVTRGNATRFDESYDVPAKGAFAGTLTLSNGADEDPGDAITIAVAGKGTASVTRTARLGFVKEKTKLLRLSVERDCIGVPCVEGKTCSGGACVPVDVDPSMLPDFSSNDEALKPGVGAAAGKGGSGGGGSGSGGSGGGGSGGSSGSGGSGGGSSGSGGSGGSSGSSGSGGSSSGSGGSGGAVSLACGPGLQSGAPWPMRGRCGTHRGQSSFVGPQTATMKWAFTTGGEVTGSPVIAADGTIYVGSDDHSLYAINPDGTKKWAFPTGDVVESTPAIGADGTVYVGSGNYLGTTDFNLYAINPDGTKKWAFTTGGPVPSSPAIGDDGTVYVGSIDNHLYAITPAGTMKWAFTTDGWVGSSPAIGPDGTIYFKSAYQFYAVDTGGAMKWMLSWGGDASPAVASGGTIYEGEGVNLLYSVTPGGVQSSLLMGMDTVECTSIGADGTVYAVGDDYNLYAVDSAGTKKWAFPMGGQVSPLPSAAIGADGTVYVSAIYTYGISADGSMKWTFPAGGHTTPAIAADGTLYFGSTDGKLYAIAP